uniref:CSON007523 protein n=1 Tax=Culicoides sonorensis TaxID=179676 RepID=A0A336LXL1_CULSO
MPESLQTKWFDFCDQLSGLKHVSFPRYVIQQVAPKHIFLHGFSDTSERAYGACIYLQCYHANSNTVTSELLCAKSRVAPTKSLSIARLELCAAKLLVDLICQVKSKVLKNVEIDDVILWSDSSIVLCWLRSEPHRWSSFVSHRVTKIQEAFSPSKWKHIPGDQNPADLVSRGCSPNELSKSYLWFHGPPFLVNDEPYPQEFALKEPTDGFEEARVTKIALISFKNSDVTNGMHYSTGYRGTRRAFAYVLRFIRNCRQRLSNLSSKPKFHQDIFKQIEMPTISDEIEAEERFLTLIQKSSFPEEYSAAAKGLQMPSKSPLKQLSPHIANGLLRVGGRIDKSVVEYDQKHPILLPKDHPYTNLGLP